MRARKQPSRVEPTACQWAAAVETVQSYYPTEIFGRGDEPIPDDLPRELKDMITSKAARMARLTCDNIARQARMMAELPEDEDKNL